MVQLIVGKKGKGKTIQLLDKVNNEIKNVAGTIVYLDKSMAHMYELNNKVRMIDVSQYLIENASEFVGFISGIVSQDHDLQQVYIDSFLKIACIENDDVLNTIEKLEKISNTQGIDIVISLSIDEAEIPESLKKNIIISL